MTLFKPAGSPPCWGVKFQDGEKECVQCRFKDGCREALLSRVVSGPPRMSLPVLTPKPPPYPPPPPLPTMQTSQALVPLPAKPYYAPPINHLPAPKPQVPMPPTQQTAQQPQPQYYQQSTGYSLPNPQNPNPLAPLHRPGAPSPAYYMTQYPGESVGTRIMKNTLLRALEAIMFELMQFFRHWTWPPSKR